MTLEVYQFETKTWLTKARNRALLPEADFTELTRDLTSLGRRLNAYIQSIGPVSLVKEAGPELYPQPQTNDAAPAAHDH